MFKRVFRGIFTLLGMLFGYGASTLIIEKVEGVSDFVGDYGNLLIVPLSVLIFGIIFFNLYQVFFKQGEVVAKDIASNMDKIPPMEIATGTIGMIMGLFVAYLISQIINGIELLQVAYINVIISVVLYVGLGYIGIIMGRRSTKDIRQLISMGTSKETARRKGKGLGGMPKILDTSVIIDGRIVDIIRTGFLEGEVVIPDFVLVELRHIADSSDSLKRVRGRRGLDILNKIQTEYGIAIYDTGNDKSLEEIPEVDVKLLKLAQKEKGCVVTNDFNLNKVATVQGINVLNINDLANALKPVVLPGESLTVFLVKEGKEENQAVAYLDDGTMIVVEGGKKLIGKNVNTTVTSVLQTSAGRMIFAKP